MRPHHRNSLDRIGGHQHNDAMIQRALQVLWPAFLMAAVLEMMTFAVVDPGDLHWFGGPSIDWPRQAVYTITFFIFWAAVSAAAAVSLWLARTAGDVNRDAF